MEWFDVHLITLDGHDFLMEGVVSVFVVVGDDDERHGLGRTVHKGHGLWRYYPDETETGPFKTVFAFTADGVITGFVYHQGALPEQQPPTQLDGMKAMLRTEFLALTAGHTPRKDYEFWLSLLLQADPIPVEDPRIKASLQRAYPHIFK